MSRESARFFFERVSHDKRFAKCFEGVDSPDTLMEIVKHWGYDFTREDLKYAVVTLSHMSDEELASVSGGVACPDLNVLRGLLALLEAS